MKGNISLKAFIEEVKTELKEAINEDDPFFELGDVELEVSFALDAEAKAGAKLYVIDIGGSTKATQTHKVKLTLTPFVESNSGIQGTPIAPQNTAQPTKNTRLIDSIVEPRQKRVSPSVGSRRTSPARIRPTAHKPAGTQRVSPVMSGGKNKPKFSK